MYRGDTYDVSNLGVIECCCDMGQAVYCFSSLMHMFDIMRLSFRLKIFPEGELRQRLLTCGAKDGLSVDDLNAMAEKVLHY